MSYLEPTNISIIRERLLKSGSTLEFKTDKVTDNVLSAVAKFLPEIKGNYKVSGNKFLTIADDNLGFELSIYVPENKWVSLKERSFYMTPAVTADLAYYKNGDDGNTREYWCNSNGKIVLYVRHNKAMEYKIDISLTGERMLKYNNDNYLVDVLNKFNKGLQMVKAGTHIETQMKFDYREPRPMPGQTIFDTGKVMKIRGEVDFTNPYIVNAVLQIRPRDLSEYSIPVTMLCILIREHIIDRGMIRACKFLNNKIVFEEFSTDLELYMYGKKIIDTGYVLTKRGNACIHNYEYDKSGKLLSIEKINCYLIKISDDNITIKLTEKDKQVDADDIAYMCGKPLPEYKFEYL